MKIKAKNLFRRFGNYIALDDVSLTVEEGEFMALLGPSGSGKTTLLRIVAGLDYPDAGTLWYDQQNATELSMRQRRIGFVFQHYALFRHMNVSSNIAFGLEVLPRSERPNRAEIRQRVQELLELVQLPELGNRYPNELSGGQRQRVALARALAIHPRVLLLDEPFGALDAKVRKEVRQWIKQLQRELRITALFVTHDQDEALELADRVAIMNKGKVEQVGSPREVRDEPATPFVQEFLSDGPAWSPPSERARPARSVAA